MQESILTAADNRELFTCVRFFLHAGGGAGFSTARLLIDGAQSVHNLRAQLFFCGRICPFVHILTGDIHILCTTGSIFAQKAASLPLGRSSFLRRRRFFYAPLKNLCARNIFLRPHAWCARSSSVAAMRVRASPRKRYSMCFAPRPGCTSGQAGHRLRVGACRHVRGRVTKTT